MKHWWTIFQTKVLHERFLVFRGNEFFLTFILRRCCWPLIFTSLISDPSSSSSSDLYLSCLNWNTIYSRGPRPRPRPPRPRRSRRPCPCRPCPCLFPTFILHDLALVLPEDESDLVALVDLALVARPITLYIYDSLSEIPEKRLQLSSLYYEPHKKRLVLSSPILLGREDAR